ncbi:MAG: DUF2380 domain-containing protein [Dyella sp.]
MRFRLATWLLVMLGVAALVPLRAAEPSPRPRLLMAEVEWVDLAPPEQRYDHADDAARVRLLDGRLRHSLRQAVAYRLLDDTPAQRHPPYRYNDCRACVTDWALKQGAQRLLLTWVQKESRLILSINMRLIDPQSGTTLGGGSLDLRGNTDAVWLAGADQLLQRTLGVALLPAATQ